MPAPESHPSAPIVIDALTLAKGGAEMEYSFRQRHFTRLSGLVVSDQPILDVELQFDLLGGKPLIRGSLHGEVELICQRCMQPMQYPLNEQFELLVCSASELPSSDISETEIEDALKTDADVEEWVADATHVDVEELVVEQVILALPLVAKHVDENVCVIATEPGTQKSVDTRQRIEVETDAAAMKLPFANLRELLKK